MNRHRGSIGLGSQCPSGTRNPNPIEPALIQPQTSTTSSFEVLLKPCQQPRGEKPRRLWPDGLAELAVDVAAPFSTMKNSVAVAMQVPLWRARLEHGPADHVIGAA